MNYNLDEWLFEKNALMPKLKLLTGDATLQVLDEQWRKLTAQECDFLSAPLHADSFWVRESRIYTHHHLAWSAMTYIPPETYHQYTALFSSLKNQALGQILYHNPLVTRHKLTTFTQDSPLFLPQEALGSRYSVFMFENRHPLYLFEAFHTGLERALIC